MQLINVAVILMTLTASVHSAGAQIDTVPIEEPPLPRPRPPLRDITSDNPAGLISAFRRQNGEGSVAISLALTRVAQEQANAMAAHDTLDHNALAPFSIRIGRSGFSRAAENIAYGCPDFASTLKQWINSTGHRANLLLHGAKWIGVAHAQNSGPNILGNGHSREVKGNAGLWWRRALGYCRVQRPLYARKRTFSGSIAMSAFCQKRT